MEILARQRINIIVKNLKQQKFFQDHPRICDYSKSFDQLSDDISDTSDGTDAQAEAAEGIQKLNNRKLSRHRCISKRSKSFEPSLDIL